MSDLRSAVLSWLAVMLLVNAALRVASWEPHFWGDDILIFGAVALTTLFFCWLLFGVYVLLLAWRRRG